MDLGEIKWGGIDGINLAQDKDWGKALVNFRVPKNVGKFLIILATVSFSRRVHPHGTSYNRFLPNPKQLIIHSII
jgi:hypothetical protein